LSDPVGLIPDRDVGHGPLSQRDILPDIAAGMTPLGAGQMAIGIGRRQSLSALGGAAATRPFVARAQHGVQ